MICKVRAVCVDRTLQGQVGCNYVKHWHRGLVAEASTPWSILWESLIPNDDERSDIQFWQRKIQVRKFMAEAAAAYSTVKVRM